MSLRLAFKTMQHRRIDARDGKQAQEALGRRAFDVAFLGLRLAREQCLDILPAVLRLAPGLSVLVVTALATS